MVPLAYRERHPNIGDGINYRPAAGLRAFRGKARQTGGLSRCVPEPRLQMDETYIYSGLRTGRSRVWPGWPRDGDVQQPHRPLQGELSVLAAALAALHPGLQFRSAERLADQPGEEKRVGLDALFTYMLNPGTALYVGYTDLYENYRLDPILSSAPPTRL